MTKSLPIELPKVSVVVPVYAGADYLGEAIQSVLDQSYQNFELIIVSDASPDNSREVAGRFDDPRLIYLEHETNQGANVARNSGIQASSGDLLAFLDQDDIFHPDKLQVHVNSLCENHDLGLTYNGHFEFDGFQTDTLQGIWQPPGNLDLTNLLLSHLIGPTDIVIRRDWAFRVGLWYADYPFFGSEMILLGRLALNGCQFASVGRALNYRRRHPGRIFKDLAYECKSELDSRDLIFTDPRCPEEILALRNVSFSFNYLVFAVRSFAQDETALGQQYVREAVVLDPVLLEGNPAGLVHHFLTSSVDDRTRSHEITLQRIFAQLPPELGYLSEEIDWAVGQGYILRGVRNIMWGRLARGHEHLIKASGLNAIVQKPFLGRLTSELLNYEAEFGSKATQAVLSDLTRELAVVAQHEDISYLSGLYFVNRAFRNYRQGSYRGALHNMFRAISFDKRYLKDRGVLAVLSRSMLRSFVESPHRYKTGNAVSNCGVRRI